MTRNALEIIYLDLRETQPDLFAPPPLSTDNPPAVEPSGTEPPVAKP